MSSAFYGVDIVDVGVYLLGIAGVVLKGYVDGDDLVGRYADGVRNQLGSAGVEVVDELLETFFGIEEFRLEHLPSRSLALAAFVLDEFFDERALVGQAYAYSLVQVCEFAQTRSERIVLVDRGLGKDSGVRMEGDDGSVLVLGAFTRDLHGGDGLALGILLHENLAFAVHFGDEKVGEGVHAGNADAVQTAGNLVVVLAELAACVEHG